MNEDDSAKDTDHCVSVYPFTAPVHKILMEEYLLHVVTETGLESYTLRTGHHLCRHLETIDDINVVSVPGKELRRVARSLRFLTIVRRRARR